MQIITPSYARLEPRTPWAGGRMKDVDVLTLEDAARFASKHAGKDIAPGDFLRAASAGEIELSATVHRAATIQKKAEGMMWGKRHPAEKTIPKGAIVPLPQSACTQLAAAGKASWRTIETEECRKLTEIAPGVVMGCPGQPEPALLVRYVLGELAPDEPDFETVPADCRVTGDAVHALADAFCDVSEPQPATESATDAPLPMTKAALIAAHKHEWQTIERDIADAKDNGLAAAAKAGARGWIESRAMDWARAKGKLKSADKPADSLAQAMHNMGILPGRRHTL